MKIESKYLISSRNPEFTLLPFHRTQVSPILALLSKVFSLKFQHFKAESADGSAISTQSSKQAKLITETKQKVMGPNAHWGEWAWCKTKQDKENRGCSNICGTDVVYNHLSHHQLITSAFLSPILPTQVVLHSLRTSTVPYSQREAQISHLGKSHLVFDVSESS